MASAVHKLAERCVAGAVTATAGKAELPFSALLHPRGYLGRYFTSGYVRRRQLLANGRNSFNTVLMHDFVLLGL